MSVIEGAERIPAVTTSSDYVLPLTLPPLLPRRNGAYTSASRPVGVALPLRRAALMDENELDPPKRTLKQLPIKQELTPSYLKTVDSSSDDDDSMFDRLPHTPPDPSHSNLRPLPRDKEYHVFVTHSSYDILRVKAELVTPLMAPPYYMKVSCSSDFMEGSDYNNDAIKHAMQRSFVIIIGVSQPYISSQRCDREWRKAMECSKNIIVIAFGECSRPPHIKKFLYLDFLDESKRAKAWEKLIFEIDEFFKQSSLRPSPHHLPDFGGMAQCFDSMTSQHQKQHSDSSSWGNTQESSTSWDNAQRDSNASWDNSSTHREGDTVTDVSNHMEDDPYVGNEDTEERSGDNLETSSDEGSGTNSNSECDSEEGEPRLPDDPPIMEGGVDVAENVEYQREEGEISDTGSPEDECHAPPMKYPRIEEASSEEQLSQSQSIDEFSSQSQNVEEFYDTLAMPGADNRDESPIYHMRNFNNWVKSVLIRKYLKTRSVVLDLCCGKGGDLNKWKEGGIDHVVCADISEVSIERCRERYNSKKMFYRGRHVFSAEFIVADCCEVRLQDRYENPAKRFNMTSCQFSLHYSFESYEKAMMMLQNACENLLPNGYFIGTTVDANELVYRLRENGQQDDMGAWTIGNEVYSVTLDENIDPHRDHLPLFNCKYHFKLEGVVNVPEYLVHYPLLIKMLEGFGMREVLHQNFYDFFQEHRVNPEDVRLLFNMHAFDKNGTMSRPQWEAIGLYLIFVFQKTS